MAENKSILLFVFISAIFFMIVTAFITMTSLESQNILTGGAIFGGNQSNETSASTNSITQFAVGVQSLFASQLKWLIMTVIAGVFIIGTAAAVFRPQFSQSRMMPQPMWPVGFIKEQVRAYILNAYSSGQPKEKIWMALVQKGWPQELISEAFKELRL
jgi:hypothetical protein